jgi:hypothetical protein
MTDKSSSPDIELPADEEALANFMYSIRSYDEAEAKAKLFWPAVRASLQPATPTAGEPVLSPLDEARIESGFYAGLECGALSVFEPATGGDAVAGDAKAGALTPGEVSADFHAYWDEHQKCPEHSLITENAANATWHAAYAKYAPDVAGDVQAARTRNAAIEECAALMRRWRDDAAEFKDERCRQQANLCQNAATAISNLAAKPIALAQPSWQPIETAPKDGTEVLLYTAPHFGPHEIAYWSERLDCWVTPDEAKEIGRLVPSAWMSLTIPSTNGNTP